MSGVGLVHIAAPRGDAGLKTVVFGGLFVAGPHVEEGEVGVDELFVRAELLGSVAFDDGFGIATLSVQSQGKRQQGVEVIGVCNQ